MVFTRVLQALRYGVESLKIPEYFPPGHHYSPIPAPGDVRKRAAQIWGKPQKGVPGIDLNEEEQLLALAEFEGYYRDLPFPERKTSGFRYYYENPNYSYSDAISLFCMIRRARPKRIVEVGSGYSSALIMDTNDLFFGGAIDVCFVEPYPDLLRSLMRGKDYEKYSLFDGAVQDLGRKVVESLQANDILFVDSTHISKAGSDVNHLFFEIMPLLSVGVYVHFHDIFYPFEYPMEWVLSGRSWNEAYLLKAFLQYNPCFKIVFWNMYLQQFFPDRFEGTMPLCLKHDGASIWLQRTEKAAARGCG